MFIDFELFFVKLFFVLTKNSSGQPGVVGVVVSDKNGLSLGGL